MASPCEGCYNKPMKLVKLYFEDNEASLEVLRNHGVLPSQVLCKNCNLPCTLRGGRWFCSRWTKIAKTKRRKQCSFTVSDYKGTFLENAHVAPSDLVVFIVLFLEKIWNHHIVFENLGWAERTSVDWRSFCSEVTQNWLTNQEAIGGPEVVVEIDESCFGKRKYGRGRQLSNIWVFRGIERESKKSFLVPLVPPLSPNRNKETLVPLIKKFILPGSIICSDGWGAYLGLDKEGYTHRVINHSEEFVDPGDRSTHTQNIERLWPDVKQWVKRPGNRPQYYQQYLSRYLFIKNTKHLRFHKFLTEAARMYPPQSERRNVAPAFAPASKDSDPDDPQPGPSSA